MKLLQAITFALLLSQISSEIVSFQDTIPGQKLAYIGDGIQLKTSYGWFPGQCKFPEINLTMSTNLTGIWYFRAMEAFDGIYKMVHPFINTLVHIYCLEFLLTYDTYNKELEMVYRCRQPNAEHFSDGCQVFVKFGLGNKIIYPVTNCPTMPKFKGIILADTDYVHYLIILGCQVTIAPNFTIVHQNAYMVLSRDIGAFKPEIYEKILSFFSINHLYFWKKPSVWAVLNDSELNKLDKCQCEQLFCPNTKNGCYPVQYPTRKRKSDKYLMNTKLNFFWLIFSIITLIYAMLSVLLYVTGRIDTNDQMF